MSAGFASIERVAFRLMNDRDHERNSNVEIRNIELMTAKGEPAPGGVYDLRLGTTDHNYLCSTCFLDKKQCPGHRGVLNLPTAVLQPIAISEIRRWLRIICLNCGEVVADRDKLENVPSALRLEKAAHSTGEGKVCPRCGTIHPKIVKDNNDYYTFRIEHVSSEKKGKRTRRSDSEKGRILFPDAIGAIFELIPDSVAEYFGRKNDSHPRNLVMRKINVPPTTIRPNMKNYGSNIGNRLHEITDMLHRITTSSLQVLHNKVPEAYKKVGAEVSREDDKTRDLLNLQQLYYSMIMGSSASATQGGNSRRAILSGTQAVKSLLHDLAGKTGRLRSNLLGKRTFFIGRTTISGNMQLRIDEVGIPISFARTLQVEETVQEYNREWLLPFFMNGRQRYPGCTRILRSATREIHDVTKLKDATLEIGDVLFRDIVTGDYAYFNRQPTLERSSIGVHRVVVIQDPSVHTFQMNVLACDYYNADQ